MKYLILIFLASCSTRYTPTVPTENKPVETDVKPLSPIVTVTECRNCNDVEKVKYEKVLAKMREVMHSQCFKDFILNRKMIQTSGRTSQEVLDHVLNQNREISIELYYNRWTKTVGFTYPNVTNIWFNRKFHTNYGICESASNLSHEGSCHKNGYEHSMQWNKDRDFSVCYSFNKAFDLCCKEVL